MKEKEKAIHLIDELKEKGISNSKIARTIGVDKVIISRLKEGAVVNEETINRYIYDIQKAFSYALEGDSIVIDKSTKEYIIDTMSERIEKISNDVNEILNILKSNK
jgi:predicted transcriptional regulator